MGLVRPIIVYELCCEEQSLKNLKVEFGGKLRWLKGQSKFSLTAEDHSPVGLLEQRKIFQDASTGYWHIAAAGKVSAFIKVYILQGETSTNAKTKPALLSFTIPELLYYPLLGSGAERGSPRRD